MPLILLGRLSSGQPLPVKVDPTDPQAIVIDWAAGALPAATGQLPGDAAGTGLGGSGTEPGRRSGRRRKPDRDARPGPGRPRRERDARGRAVRDDRAGAYSVDQLRAIVRANGIDGTATIDKLADTGETIGDERLFTMQVTLHIPGQPDRQLQPSAAMVPIAARRACRSRQDRAGEVARDNPDLVVFEWEQLEPGGPSTIL